LTKNGRNLTKNAAAAFGFEKWRNLAKFGKKWRIYILTVISIVIGK
jgi:hypothetical protein